jgi:hypothetical protein
MAERAAGPEPGDAFGQALLELTAGRTGSVIIERDDGFVTAESLDYNAPDGPDLRALDRAVGRVLDVGANPGLVPPAAAKRAEGRPIRPRPRRQSRSRSLYIMCIIGAW